MSNPFYSSTSVPVKSQTGKLLCPERRCPNAVLGKIHQVYKIFSQDQIICDEEKKFSKDHMIIIDL